MVWIRSVLYVREGSETETSSYRSRARRMSRRASFDTLFFAEDVHGGRHRLLDVRADLGVVDAVALHQVLDALAFAVDGVFDNVVRFDHRSSRPAVGGGVPLLAPTAPGSTGGSTSPSSLLAE